MVMRFLKNILICLVVCPVIFSCGIYRQTAEERLALIEAIEQPDVILDITQILPFGYPSRSSTGEYALRIQGNKVNTRLPFIGDSRVAVFSTDEISIVFEDEEVELQHDFSGADHGEYQFLFKGGKGQDKWKVYLQLFDSGNAYIRCTSTSGRKMSYVANIVIPEHGKKK